MGRSIKFEDERALLSVMDISPETARSAMLTVCEAARDADEVRELLDALGLLAADR